MYSMTLLDESGDTMIVWDEDTEDAILEVIEKKMKAGVTFYITKPRALAILPPKKVKAKKIADIREAGQVAIKDKDLESLFNTGKVQIARAQNDDEIVAVKRATDAREVAKADSVAVRVQRGG